MKFLKNRTVLGIVCIALSLLICFVITPMFNASASKTAEIVRIRKDVKIGAEITAKDIEVVEVGSYNLPAEVVKKSDEVVGKYATMEMAVGEYVLATKISDSPASENAYLYGLNGEKRAISVTIPSFAGGLSGKLISGDIVSVIAVDYLEQGETVVPDELQYVEVIAVTDKSGNDEATTKVTADGEEETELPETVTLLVSPVQANILASLEAEGEIHLSLVYRGTAENAQKFIDAQEKLLKKPAEDNENEQADDKEMNPSEDLEDIPDLAETEESPEDDFTVIIEEEKPETTEEMEETADA